MWLACAASFSPAIIMVAQAYWNTYRTRSDCGGALPDSWSKFGEKLKRANEGETKDCGDLRGGSGGVGEEKKRREERGSPDSLESPGRSTADQRHRSKLEN